MERRQLGLVFRMFVLASNIVISALFVFFFLGINLMGTHAVVLQEQNQLIAMCELLMNFVVLVANLKLTWDWLKTSNTN